MKHFRLWIAVNACLVVALPLAAGAQDFSLDHSSLDFGPVTVGSTAVLSLTLTGTMNSPLIATDIGFLEAGSNPDGVFSIVDISSPAPFYSLPAILAAGQSIVTQVSFAPTSLGSYSGYFTIESNHHAFPDFDVPLSGEGVPMVPVPPALCLVVYGLASVAAGRGVLRKN